MGGVIADVNTEAGDTYTFHEMAAWLRDAGPTTRFSQSMVS